MSDVTGGFSFSNMVPDNGLKIETIGSTPSVHNLLTPDKKQSSLSKPYINKERTFPEFPHSITARSNAVKYCSSGMLPFPGISNFLNVGLNISMLKAISVIPAFFNLSSTVISAGGILIK